MNRRIYRQVAKKYGVSVVEVKREMQIAIDAAYIKPNAAALMVPRMGMTPTPDEFIDYAVDRLKRQRT